MRAHDLVGRADGADPLQELERHGTGQLGPPGTVPRPAHQLGEPELGEHLPVAGRAKVDRQLRGELRPRLPRPAFGQPGPTPPGRAVLPAAVASASTVARTALTCSGGTRFSTTSSACRAATRVIAGPNAATEMRTCRGGDGAGGSRASARAGRRTASARRPGSRAGTRPSRACATRREPTRGRATGHDRRTGRPERDADVAAGERGHRRDAERDGDRASHADRERADLDSHALRAMADGCCQRERVEGRQLADPERAEPGALHLEGDADRLVVRPVEPEGKHPLDPRAQRTAVLAS